MNKHSPIGPLVLAAGLVFVLGATLWPFAFEFRYFTWREYLTEFEWVPSSLLDFPRNVVLFVPFGWGLALLLGARGLGTGALATVTVLAGFAAALIVESLQLFLPDRTSNWSDVAANTLGAAAGLGCWWAQNRERSGSLPNPLKTLILAAVYLVGTLTVTWGLWVGLRPRGWDPNYRLAVGNEFTGDRRWRGTLHDLLLFDRALDRSEAERLLVGEIPERSRSSLMAAYRPEGDAGLRDETGQLPDLVPAAAGIARAVQGPLESTELGWLVTAQPVPSVAHRINATRQFTAAVTVTTADANQAGPARIVTVSEDPFHRNLTIGQEGDGVAVRWRSLLSGPNGATPELVFPGLLDRPERQRIVVTVDGSTVVVYAGGRAVESVTLGPEVALSALFRDQQPWPVEVRPRAFWFSAVTFAALLFTPFGVLLGIPTAPTRNESPRAPLLAMLLLLPILVEGALAWRFGGGLRIPTLAMGAAFSVAGFRLAKWWR